MNPRILLQRSTTRLPTILRKLEIARLGSLRVNLSAHSSPWRIGTFRWSNLEISELRTESRHVHSFARQHNVPRICILHRFLSSNNGGEEYNRNSHSSDEDETNYSHLLTRATARQLKGDIPEAIELTSRALLILRERQLSGRDEYNDEGTKRDEKHNTNHLIRESEEEDLADAMVFLGKLLRLQGQWEDASRSFSEARWIFHSLQYGQTLPGNVKKRSGLRYKECTALSFYATAIAQLDHPTDLVDSAFREALEGLAEIVGWKDGITNYTAMEFSNFLKQKKEYSKAIEIVRRAQAELSEVFGDKDRRVLQLNGDLSDLLQLEAGAGANHHETAISLLEQALESLPPNSPEARRLFVKLEDLKEEMDTTHQGLLNDELMETTKIKKGPNQ